MEMQKNKGRLIVTSGKKYIDIDAYASCIVYANLLSKVGINAVALISAEINESVPKEIFSRKNTMLNGYTYQSGDKFIVLDVSNKEYFDTFVRERDIVQIIDHHYEVSLLMAAILDNTLNFKAKITSNRDKLAYQKLLKINQDDEFEKKYFEACQNIIQNNLKYYAKSVAKCENLSENLPKIFSQLMVWNKNKILLNLEEINSGLDELGEDWILNLIVLEEEKSYIISKNIMTKRKIEKLFGLEFNENILELDYVWLRKEIIGKALRENGKMI